MISGDNPAEPQVRDSEGANMIGGSVIHWKAEGQVEVTVKKGSIPANTELVAAH